METIELMQGEKKGITTRLTVKLIEALNDRADELNLSRTELVERYLIQGLTQSK